MTTITADYFTTSILPSQSFSIHREASIAKDPGWIVGDAAAPLQVQTISELGKIAIECETPGWDGFSAKPISMTTLTRAATFLCALPTSMVAPEIVPEADGNIAIEWYLGPNRSFSVSIGETGPVNYAGLFSGDEEIHGAAPFLGQVPNSIVYLLARIFREGTSRRAA